MLKISVFHGVPGVPRLGKWNALCAVSSWNFFTQVNRSIKVHPLQGHLFQVMFY